VDFHEGPIDYLTGKKTSTWYVVKQMNEEIKGLSNVFLGARVIKVEHIVKNDIGEDDVIPNGTKRFNFSNRPREASIIKMFTFIGKTNALISFLKNNKKCYMIVINRNLEGGDDMFVTIEGKTGLNFINKDGTAFPVSSKNSNQTITPGDALIYGWDI